MYDLLMEYDLVLPDEPHFAVHLRGNSGSQWFTEFSARKRITHWSALPMEAPVTIDEHILPLFNSPVLFVS